MAVSGSQKTRIGASISSVGIAITITAKAEGVIPVVFCALVAVMEGEDIAAKEGELTAELECGEFSRICT